MRLSVVVTVVDAGEALSRCLGALTAQEHPPRMEVIVPYDTTVSEVAALASRYPAFTFLPVGEIPTERPAASAAGQHELYDRRRAAGLLAASGDLIAILEDRGLPRPGWAAAAARLHAELPHAAIGGAIENGCDRVLNWAVYFCDFGRYQLPLVAGRRTYVSDVNICYKRRALEQTRNLWEEMYHEPTVNGALAAAGEALFLTPDMVVDQVRGRLRPLSLLGERVAWGRLFGGRRVAGAGRLRKAILAALSPLLPALLLFRLVRDRLVKRSSLWPFVKALPWVCVLVSAWSLGEASGYFARRRQVRRPSQASLNRVRFQ
jgi:hypothetical protein